MYTYSLSAAKNGANIKHQVRAIGSSSCAYVCVSVCVRTCIVIIIIIIRCRAGPRTMDGLTTVGLNTIITYYRGMI